MKESQRVFKQALPHDKLRSEKGLMAAKTTLAKVPNSGASHSLIQGKLSCEILRTSFFIQELFSGARYLAGGPAKKPVQIQPAE
jgi:hypothetical protein